MSEQPELRWPVPGEVYTDSYGRRLLITRVSSKDKLERNVEGELTTNDKTEPYATSMVIFPVVWTLVKQ